MNNTEKKAEALFQLSVAQKSGIKKIARTNDEMIIFYNNGTVAVNNFNTIEVQFELQGNLYSIPV